MAPKVSLGTLLGGSETAGTSLGGSGAETTETTENIVVQGSPATPVPRALGIPVTPQNFHFGLCSENANKSKENNKFNKIFPRIIK